MEPTHKPSNQQHHNKKMSIPMQWYPQKDTINEPKWPIKKHQSPYNGIHKDTTNAPTSSIRKYQSSCNDINKRHQKITKISYKKNTNLPQSKGHDLLSTINTQKTEEQLKKSKDGNIHWAPANWERRGAIF